MEERFAYLVDPEFDLNQALSSPEAVQTLRDAEDLLAAETLAWRQNGRDGFTPDEFPRWNKALEALKAAKHTVEMLRLKIG